ncbi:MAG: ribosome small subunit-dependent GTPase A [Candidatus Margulisiibacteriota bacterium]|jgi:ribosome biogenesis GTPase
MKLENLGWDHFFEKHFAQYQVLGYRPLRIIRENRLKYLAIGDQGEFKCEVTGKFRNKAGGKGNYPAVGDWVAVKMCPNEAKAMIHQVLPKKSAFIRKVAGTITEEQVVASNIDVVFIVCGLDLNYNLRRIERYLALAWESGAQPVVLLNKADICEKLDQYKSEVESIAVGVSIYTISATQNQGLEIINTYVQMGKTAVFLGSSGVGKSTIINSLLAFEQFRINDVSELGSRGRHTTTFRQLVFLPNGGMLIDTPGMREVQVWGEDVGLKQVFDDIEQLATQCKFRDCQHQNEISCAVLKAKEAGTIDQNRYNSYMKLKSEFSYLEARQIMKPNALEKTRWKKISKQIKLLEKDY